MTSALKARAVRGLFWSMFNQVGLQGIQLVTGIILARLLLPSEFGLVAVLAIFIALAHSFVNRGFGAALIQKSSLDPVTLRRYSISTYRLPDYFMRSFTLQRRRLQCFMMNLFSHYSLAFWRLISSSVLSASFRPIS
jgi:Polysaccharide biosynthesis protein